MPKKFFPLYLLLVMLAGHFTNEYFAAASEPLLPPGFALVSGEVPESSAVQCLPCTKDG